MGDGTGTDFGALLTERVAAHFDGARVAGHVVHTGLAGLTITCAVRSLDRVGATHAASLGFQLAGPPLGPEPVTASMNGYHQQPDLAVVEGACHWTCTMRALLLPAVGLPPPDDDLLDVETDEVRLDGRAFTVFSMGLDRTAAFSADVDPQQRTAAARGRLPEPGMSRGVLRSPDLPVLAGDHAVVLGTFVSQNGETQTTEVLVQGGAWPAAWPALTASGPEPAGAVTMLRELAVLVPRESARLRRDPLVRTLALIGAQRTAPFQAAGWRGWWTHGGRLAPPLPAADVAALERSVGPLAPDHRDFLTTVAGSGAGPGYGLLAPRRVPDGVLLAEAGCGPHWVLRPDGSVWADARATDGTFAPVAASFTAWYAAWLTHAVADTGPWTAWDWRRCACLDLLSRLRVEHGRPGEEVPDLGGAVEPRGVQVTVGAGSTHPPGSVVDPGHACAEVYSQFGLGDVVFEPGVFSGVAAVPPRRNRFGPR